MLLKAFHGGKAIKIPAVSEFDCNIYDIFLKCNCANCTLHYVLDFAPHNSGYNYQMDWNTHSKNG